MIGSCQGGRAGGRPVLGVSGEGLPHPSAVLPMTKAALGPGAPRMGSIAYNSSEALALGAQWAVDGGQWHDSGDTVTLASGEHTVSFEDVDTGIWGCFKPWIGWRPPEDLLVSITANEITTATGTYTFGAKSSTPASKSRNATGDLLLGAALAASLWRIGGKRGGVAR